MDMRYPIGPWKPKESYSKAETEAHLGVLEAFPARFRNLTEGLTDTQLDTQYREDGWTLRQVVHHVADSHANMVVRVKLALTETNPTIKPYEEQLWALLPDYAEPVEGSLQMIEALHKKLILVLKNADDGAFAKTYTHPANKRTSTITEVVALYAWHSEHHYQHINQTIIAQKW